MQVRITSPDCLAGRFKTGDIAEVIKHHPRLTELRKWNYLVEFPNPRFCGTQPLGRRHLFTSSQVEKIGSAVSIQGQTL